MPSTRPLRQLVIGLDAMEWSLVSTWMAEGKLPAFRRVFDRGVHARLESPARALPDTSWPALCTGVNPAKLGKYFYVQYDPASARLRYVADDEIRATPFWQRLDAAGVRVGIADVPHMPHGSACGFRITNWGSHDNVHHTRSSPPELHGEILARFGLHPVQDCEKFDANARSLRALRHRLLEGIGAHGRLFRWLMTSQPWDVFFGVFAASHCAGHHFWGETDSTHPDHAQDSADLAGTIEEVYRAIDHEVGGMLDLVDEGSRLMLVAAHGMGPLHHASWNLNQILDLLDLSGPTAVKRGERSHEPRFNPWRVLKMAAPSRWQYAVKERLPKSWQDYLVFLWYAGGRRLEGRRAFAVPNNEVVGAIRISLKGRDRGGVVAPGAEYEALCGAIAEALAELTDPVTGRKVITDIIRTQQEFHGPFSMALPDLCVRWDGDFTWHAVQSPRFGVLKLRRLDARTGSHKPYGFLLAQGPGFPAGVELAKCSVYDIAPTLLEGAGVTVPVELDGRPLTMALGVTA